MRTLGAGSALGGVTWQFNRFRPEAGGGPRRQLVESVRRSVHAERAGMRVGVPRGGHSQELPASAARGLGDGGGRLGLTHIPEVGVETLAVPVDHGVTQHGSSLEEIHVRNKLTLPNDRTVMPYDQRLCST